MVLCSGAARADAVRITGDTTGGPTFNRPFDDVVKPEFRGTPVTPTSLSGIIVPYSIVKFTGSTSGIYQLTAVGDDPSRFNIFLALYANNFDPSAPLTNALLVLDDIADPEKNYASFSTNLTAGVNYFAVITGSRPNDFGSFYLDISGPGIITATNQAAAVPEPATLLMLGTALAGMGATVRRRRKLREFPRRAYF